MSELPPLLAVAFVLVAPLAVGLAVAGGASERYRLDPERSELVVLVSKAGVGAAFAHDHVVRATRYESAIELVRDARGGAAAVSLLVDVDARSLRVDEPALRAKYGLATGMSDDDRAQTQANMEGDGQLDVARHSRIVLRSVAVERLRPDAYRVDADLTLHGVTRRVSFVATGGEERTEIRAHGALRFRQSDFGIAPYSALLGAVRNQDEVELRFTAVAVTR